MHVFVNIVSMGDIDPSQSSFRVTVRLYMMWNPTALDGIETEWCRMAIANGEYYSLHEDQVKALLNVHKVPKAHFLNAIDVQVVEEVPSIRLYHHETRGTALMWNRLFNLTLRQTFEFAEFPFDSHALELDIRQNDSRTWDLFDLRVCSIQFHRQALLQSEWHVFAPRVRRVDSKCTVCEIVVQRDPQYYLVNIVGIVLVLTGLCRFVCQGERERFRD